jgi:hypothetical protein
VPTLHLIGLTQPTILNKVVSIMEIKTNNSLEEAFANNLKLVMFDVVDPYEKNKLAIFLKSIKKDNDGVLPPNIDLNDDTYEWIVNIFNAQTVKQTLKCTKEFIKHRALQYRKKYRMLQEVLGDMNEASS